jgi:putative tryptophan/tyrosine transport system substrate-binding protein
MISVSIGRFVLRHKLILTSLLLACCLTPAVGAENRVLSIQSTTITPYEEALKGFQSTCSVPVDRFILSEMKGRDIVQEIKKASPSVILSIGMDALEKVKGIEDVPVVFMMTPGPKTIPESGKGMNFTGVRMNIAQEEQISLFLKAVPSIKAIGMIYNPDKTGYFAQRAIDACKKAGINLIAKEVSDPRESPPAIKAMEGEIDGFWMLPDSSLFTSETIEYLFLFSIGNRVPILTFSEIYLESGALISVGVDSFDMGAQAGSMAKEILAGKPPSSIPSVDAKKEVVSINAKTSEKLGIHIDEKLFSGARFIK